MKKLLLALALACASMYAQQTTKQDSFNQHVHVPIAAIPTSTTDALVNSPGVTVTSMWFVNTNASTTVTVTVTCKGGSTLAILQLAGYTSTGNNVAVQLPADGVYCATGVTWSASGSGVNGTMSGRF